jgi:hypothetical protein
MPPRSALVVLVACAGHRRIAIGLGIRRIWCGLGLRRFAGRFEAVRAVLTR